MQYDLRGHLRAPQPARVRLYADEIKPYRNAQNEHWMYLGLVAIPENFHRTALSGLTDDRDTADYEGEVHFVDLHNYSYAHVHNEKTLLAKRWVERVLTDRQKGFHF